MVVDAAVVAKILGEKSRLSRREQIGGERGRTSQASNLYSSVREVSLAERVLFPLPPSLSLSFPLFGDRRAAGGETGIQNGLVSNFSLKQASRASLGKTVSTIRSWSRDFVSYFFPPSLRFPPAN